MNSAALLILAIVGMAAAFWFHRSRTQAVSDEQLREWFSFITKPNGRPSPMRLNPYEYDAIRLLFHPALKAEFEEKLTRLENEFSARAIETALVIRRQAKGLPMSEADDRILIREGLRKQTTEVNVLEFTPGRKFDDPNTEYRNEN